MRDYKAAGTRARSQPFPSLRIDRRVLRPAIVAAAVVLIVGAALWLAFASGDGDDGEVAVPPATAATTPRNSRAIPLTLPPMPYGKGSEQDEAEVAAPR
ncbi:hypothetical protein [Thiohalocapsa sp. ML1]|jgi:hypothetical protein|uniref:hypothetical protein n=1 Tax=Thiohalocapsa sp. ML1 TaxID=1431688 RepID=UPI0012E393BB|nr:hypothetical protein [Thiohalocapsa sp. ML1]